VKTLTLKGLTKTNDFKTLNFQRDIYGQYVKMVKTLLE